MKLYQIKRRIDVALALLKINDNYLLKNDVNERSITHKFAIYLEQVFGREFDVDCEYNKDIIGEDRIKRLYFSNREGTIKYSDVYPDIIVHKRGRRDHNLLVVELKKSTRSMEEIRHDLEKVKCYTEDNGLNQLAYQYGAFIKLYCKQNKYRRPEVIYFKNGERID